MSQIGCGRYKRSEFAFFLVIDDVIENEPDPEQEEFRKHLAGCEECNKFFTRIKPEVKKAIDRVFRDDPPDA